jgi:hypothetical protein
MIPFFCQLPSRSDSNLLVLLPTGSDANASEITIHETEEDGCFVEGYPKKSTNNCNHRDYDDEGKEGPI